MTLICLTIMCLKIPKSDYKTNMYRPMCHVSTVLNGTTFYMSFKKKTDSRQQMDWGLKLWVIVSLKNLILTGTTLSVLLKKEEAI